MEQKAKEETLAKLKTYFKDVCYTLSYQNVSYTEWNEYYEMFEKTIKANVQGLDYIKIANSLAGASVICILDDEEKALKSKQLPLITLATFLSNPEERQKRPNLTIDKLYTEIFTTSNNNNILPSDRVGRK